MKKYYEINEAAAKRSHEMKSFRGYKENETTNAYKKEVDQVYEILQNVIKKRPKKAEQALKLFDRFSKNLAYYYNRESEIGTRCPSVLICGSGNFPTRKKEKQVEAWKKNHEFYKEKVEAVKEKLERLEFCQEIIKSSDDDAIEALEEKLRKRKENHEFMKNVNKALRIKDEEKKKNKLLELCKNDDKLAEELTKPDFCGRVGFTFDLQNNYQNIKRIEKRIRELKRLKAAAEEEKPENNIGVFEEMNIKYIENAEIMRIQFIFEGVPDVEIRKILKAHAFRWSPKNKAWQRQLTRNGEYAAKKVIEELEQIRGVENE